MSDNYQNTQGSYGQRGMTARSMDYTVDMVFCENHSVVVIKSVAYCKNNKVAAFFKAPESKVCCCVVAAAFDGNVKTCGNFCFYFFADFGIESVEYFVNKICFFGNFDSSGVCFGKSNIFCAFYINRNLPEGICVILTALSVVLTC